MIAKNDQRPFSQKADYADFLTENRINLRIGYSVIESGSDVGAQVKLAVESYNQTARLQGLKDELNPEVLDLSKVWAFLEGLSKQPTETLLSLKGDTIYLNASSLRLGTSSPATAAAIEQGYALTVPANEGGLLEPVLKVEIDKNLAQSLASEARENTALLNQKVGQLEAEEEKASQLRELSLAQSKRFAAAMVWRDNSQVLLEAEPSNSQFQAELAKAKKAVAEYSVPSWIGLP